nr:helix-turn-helix transcriptional regulator [Clostridium sp. MD294]
MIILNFSENLKILLDKQNLKQADLCRLTGIQTSLMSEYVKGKKSPTIKNAIAIADAFRISLDTLVSNQVLSDNSLVSAKPMPENIINELNVDNEIKQLVKEYSLLSDDDKELIKKMINSLSKKN